MPFGIRRWTYSLQVPLSDPYPLYEPESLKDWRAHSSSRAFASASSLIPGFTIRRRTGTMVILGGGRAVDLRASEAKFIRPRTMALPLFWLFPGVDCFGLSRGRKATITTISLFVFGRTLLINMVGHSEKGKDMAEREERTWRERWWVL
jgi:hypothetical protein